jgi:hypothetical protein
MLLLTLALRQAQREGEHFQILDITLSLSKVEVKQTATSF